MGRGDGLSHSNGGGKGNDMGLTQDKKDNNDNKSTVGALGGEVWGFNNTCNDNIRRDSNNNDECKYIGK